MILIFFEKRMTRFDELILNRISEYLDYRDILRMITLIPRELREDMDNFVSFMPKYYYLFSLETKSRLREKEHIISRNPEWSYLYSLIILCGRWSLEDDRLEKERVIGQIPKWSVYYACNIIKDRWSVEDGRDEKEKVIMEEFYWNYWYKHCIIYDWSKIDPHFF